MNFYSFLFEALSSLRKSKISASVGCEDLFSCCVGYEPNLLHRFHWGDQARKPTRTRTWGRNLYLHPDRGLDRVSGSVRRGWKAVDPGRLSAKTSARESPIWTSGRLSFPRARQAARPSCARGSTAGRPTARSRPETAPARGPGHPTRGPFQTADQVVSGEGPRPSGHHRLTTP